jgi:hypothetical protein
LNRTFLVLGLAFSDDFFIFLLLIPVLVICFKISFNRLSTSFIGPAYVLFLKYALNDIKSDRRCQITSWLTSI